MKIDRIILIAFSLFLLVGITTAADLAPSTISNPDWLVAGSGAQSTITVHVMQVSSPTDVSGANVVFSLADDSMDLGTLSTPSAVTTGTDGIAKTVFTTSTKSGTATINARITYNDGTTTTISRSCIQQIDHATPQTASPDQQYNVPVGTVTHLNITLKDYWKNRIDNKNPAEAHNVVLHISGDGGSGFLNGTVQDLTTPTDAHGNISVDLRVSTIAGANTIQIYPIGSFLGDLITIMGVADSDPSYLIQVPPASLSYPADGKDPEHQFTFYWKVQDQYHNPMNNVELLIKASRDTPPKVEELRLTTNADGIATIPYGPKEVAAVYTIKAMPVISGTTIAKNATLICTDTSDKGFCIQTVEYTSLDPVNMILTASPQTMVSMDVAGAKQVDVIARVVDVSGNGVKGQTVTFTRTSDTVGTFKETSSSSLIPKPPATTLSVTTDNNGYANVQFVPGTFATAGQTGYNAAATGSCDVKATWINPKTGDKKEPVIHFVWKNYPFLSVESAIDNPDPKVGDTINVKIWIKGTGALLRSKPINAVLCIDRSGSMLYDSPDRMYSIREAAKTFVVQMSSKDSVALVTFGRKGTIRTAGESSFDHPHNYIDNTYTTPKTYSDYSTIDSSLTSLDPNVNPNAALDLKSTLDKIVPDYGTPMRDGLHKSIQQLPESSSTSVNAIVLLSDGDYNYYGDPLARRNGYSSSQYDATDYGDLDQDYMKYSDVDNQNLALYAKSKGIKIYTIAYGTSLSTGGSTTLDTLATSSGGKYYTASASDIAAVYTQIAGELNVQAGGNTQLVADFGNLKLNNLPLPLGETVDTYIGYQYNNGGVDSETTSTLLKKYPEVPVTPPKNEYYKMIRDDRGNWTNPTTIPGLTPYKLDFYVGKIILNDVWMTNLQFKVKKAGQIELFGPSSPVTFTDITDPLHPTTQIVDVPPIGWTIHEKNPLDDPFGLLVALNVTDVLITPQTSDPNLWQVSWKTGYDGSNSVGERLLYCSETSSYPVSCAADHNLWPVFPNQPTSLTGNGISTITPNSLIVDTSTLKLGETYRVTVWAKESTTGGKENAGSASYMKGDGSKRVYIKLE
ncbi:MAG: VWA domain-containing protein [Methanoregula sp.]|nr:VWA domain-containing protein [Methanoregula sp.]